MAEGLFNPPQALPDEALMARVAAVETGMPAPALTVPANESTTGSAGSDSTKYSQQGHSHPRLTSTTNAILGADGTTTVTFTRAFTNQPGVVMTEVNALGNQPLVMVVQSFVKTGNDFTGAVIKGYRSNTLPSQNQLSLASLLSGVVGSVNAIASSLTGFNVFGGTSAGAQVSVIAIARSDMPQ